MQSQSVRSYIKAPAPRDVEKSKSPLPASKKKNTKELLSWVFGVDGNDAVIGESRDLQELNIVLQDKSATEVLRDTRDLTEAYLVSPGQRDELAKRLQKAEALLRTTHDEVESQKDDPVIIQWVEACGKAARALGKAIK